MLSLHGALPIYGGAGVGDVAVRGAGPWRRAGRLRGLDAADRGQPGAGPADQHARAVAVPGDADDVLRVPAVDPAVGLHVPVRGHAAGGAVAGRSEEHTSEPQSLMRISYA